PANAPYDWLVLAWAVNIAWHPPNPEPERYACVQATGAVDATPESLLQHYTRHFLSTVNRWADRGFESIARAWQTNAAGIGETLVLGTGQRDEAGTFEGLNESGRILRTNGEGQRDTLDAALALAVKIEA
ncbi:MAG: biotin/lipoate--protein ligase family protein, partial [Gammaproteobacteria bacterium]